MNLNKHTSHLYSRVFDSDYTFLTNLLSREQAFFN